MSKLSGFISRCIICLWWIYFNIFNACIPIKQTDFKNNFSFFEYFNKIPLSLYYNHFLLYKKLYGEFPELLSILSFLILFLKEFFYWDAFFRILKRKDHRNFYHWISSQKWRRIIFLQNDIFRKILWIISYHLIRNYGWNSLFFLHLFI